MNRILLTLLLTAIAAPAADREFRDIVHAISDHYHTNPTHIPFFGLVNAATFVARPAGMRHIDLAVFENLHGTMDPNVVRNIVGPSWKPFVQVLSRRKGSEETTLIYMRNEGADTRLLITAIERGEATVVQLKMNAEALRRWMDDPRHSAHER